MGPGAHAFDGSVRRWNAARLDGYLAALAPAGGGAPAALPPGDSEAVDADAAAVEAVILGLRLDEGLARDLAEHGPLAPHLALGPGAPVSWSPWTRLPASGSASRPRAACSRTSCSRASSERHAHRSTTMVAAAGAPRAACIEELQGWQ